MPQETIRVIRKKKENGLKAVLEIVSLTFLAIPMIYVHMIAGSSFKPYRRGFFCDDQNLKHPYVEQTVPMEWCFLIWASLITLFILLIELLRNWDEPKGRMYEYELRFSWILVELYRQFGYMIIGATTCFLFTDLSKFSIGRLRPHFLTICKPAYVEVCKDEHGFEQFVTGKDEEICLGLQNNETTPRMLKEARLSFMSGHSSFSFYCATFLILYLQARLNKFPKSSTSSGNIIQQMLKILRPFMQFGLAILAFWIALTRISDYFHHPLDVACGSLVGIGFAGITISVAGIFNKPTAFWKSVTENLRNRETIEAPQIEKNDVYNLEDDYYDEHETRIEDMNMYYE